MIADLPPVAPSVVHVLEGDYTPVNPNPIPIIVQNTQQPSVVVIPADALDPSPNVVYLNGNNGYRHFNPWYHRWYDRGHSLLGGIGHGVNRLLGHL